VPVVAAAVLAHAQLGALAASNKLSSRRMDSAELARLASGEASHVGFLQLDAAGRHTGLSREFGPSAGKPVVLAGFVSAEADLPAHPFELSGSYITCCVADAVPMGVHVLAPAGGTQRPSTATTGSTSPVCSPADTASGSFGRSASSESIRPPIPTSPPRAERCVA
jgi:hypothetical protein